MTVLSSIYYHRNNKTIIMYSIVILTFCLLSFYISSITDNSFVQFEFFLKRFLYFFCFKKCNSSFHFLYLVCQAVLQYCIHWNHKYNNISLSALCFQGFRLLITHTILSFQMLQFLRVLFEIFCFCSSNLFFNVFITFAVNFVIIKLIKSFFNKLF